MRLVGENLKVETEYRELTDRELLALYYLANAWDAFYVSGMEEDPYDSVALEEFIRAVNTAQNIIMSRVFSKLSIKLRGDE